MVRKYRNLLAISWDRAHLLFVLARARGEAITLLAAQSIPLAGSQPVAEQIAEIVRAELARQGIKRVEILVGLGRSQAELIDCHLPPASDEELPALVCNEVLRQLGETGEQAIVDFEPLDSDAAQSRAVTAAILAPEPMAQIEQVCAAIGHAPQCATLRVYAVASLFRRLVPHSQTPALLLHVQSADVDIAAYHDNHIRFSRTVRLSQSPNVDLPRMLLEEIRRTIAVAPVPHPGASEETVQHVYLFGDLTSQEELLVYLTEQLHCPVSLLNPLDGIETMADLAAERSQYFAALIGIVRDAVSGTHTLDFLHPKQPKPPPGLWRRVAFAAAGVVTVLVAIGWYMSSELNRLDRTNQQLAARVKKAEETVKRLQRQQAIVAWVDGWQASDVNWLDEIRDLSLRFPSGQDAVIGRLSCGPRPTGGGATVDMQVQVRHPEIVTAMEESLRDDYHVVQSNRISAVVSPLYTWQFQTRMDVRPRSAADYLAGLPKPAKPASVTEPPPPSPPVTQPFVALPATVANAPLDPHRDASQRLQAVARQQEARK